MSYVDAGFYAKLVGNFARWPEEAISDTATRERCRMLLERGCILPRRRALQICPSDSTITRNDAIL